MCLKINLIIRPKKERLLIKKGVLQAFSYDFMKFDPKLNRLRNSFLKKISQFLKLIKNIFRF